MRTHAVFLRLDGRRCVVVGGDVEAERKVERCLAAGAAVTVIAVDLTPGLERHRADGRLQCLRRAYREGDLRGAAVAYAAVRDPATIAALRAEADREHVWLNVVDVPEASTFFAPALVTRGELQIAIGTGGASPGLASRLRRSIETQVGPEYERYVAILAAVRDSLPAGGRSEVMERLVDSELLALVRRGDVGAIDGLLGRLAGEACTLERLGLEPGEAGLPWT
jgi:precorrin-2 dehydrogenase/sirohydrochlorin ferrochelatase